MKYLLDTNICIYIIKQHPATVLKKFNAISVGDIGISSVTLSELMYGVEKSQQRKKNMTALEKFLLPLEILYYDDAASLRYGNVRATLEKKGRPIGPLDTMIAAHALSLDCILVTNNKKEFKRVPHLRIEDWAT